MDGRRVTAVVLGLVGAVVVAVLAWSGAFRAADSEPSPSGPVAEVFPVPTWEWDEGGGNDALVAGRLGFTDAGCPLLVVGEGAGEGAGDDVRATALFFPNASGVRYVNGVRGVVDGSGRVYAIEGAEFSYAGGWSEPAPAEFTAAWDALCAATPLRDAAIVNEVAANPPLDAAPAAPSSPLPTAPSTAAELGWLPVPTFEWDPADGGDTALIEGTVTFVAEGCPVVETGGTVTGLILPNAEGFRQPDGTLSVYSWFPDGSSGLMVMEGEPISYGGGSGPADDPRWTGFCPTVDGVFLVEDRPFG